MKKKLIVMFITMIVVLTACFSLYFTINKKEALDFNNQTSTEDKINLNLDPEAALHKQIYENNKYDNPDYRGQIIFESGLINEPFVQTMDNDFYLRRDYKTYNYSLLGTVFMDYESSLDSQNVILYGHTALSTYDAGVDDSGNKINNDSLMFTSLKYFTEKDFYEKNKYVDLILEDRIKTYVIVSSFYADVVIKDGIETLDDGLYYFIPEYDREYFVYYKQNIKNIEFYNTNEDFNYEDKFLTLQTCVDGNESLRQIVLCKLIDTKFY